jgi:hypothetical protein
MIMVRKIIMAVCISGFALICSCVSSGRQYVNLPDGPVPLYEDISWVSFSIQQPYIDEDKDGKFDGVIVEVMLNRPKEKAFFAGRGELIMYLIQREKDEKGRFINKVLYDWNIPEDAFADAVVRQRFGLICHRMALHWGALNPGGTGLYMKAEFVRTDGNHIASGMVPLSILR